MPTMMASATFLAQFRPQPVPDLSREALLARLHFPAPRTGDLESMLELPPRTAGRNKGQAPVPSRQYQAGGDSGAGLTGGLPSNLLLTATSQDGQLNTLASVAFPVTTLRQMALAEFQDHTKPGIHDEGHQPGWRLLPLSCYQELRARMDRQLAAHAILRERWLGILLPRLRPHAATARDSDANREPPTEETLRQQWQARLELKPAPTLPEYMGIAKYPELARWKREAYRQAAVSCRNINRQSEYRRMRNRTGYAPWE